MPSTPAHKRLAGKFMFKKTFPQGFESDALVELVAHIYTEEEASVACALSFTPKPAALIARRLKRPVSEIRPILEAMSERLTIIGVKAAGVPLYGFAMLVPGVYEFQMIRSRGEGADLAHYKRFAELFEDLYSEYLAWAQPRTLGKDLRFGRIVAVEKSLERTSGVMPLATDRYSEIVERNKSFCLVNVCACRREQELLGKGCGRGMDVCSGMGMLADLAIEKGLARRVSREEFMEAKTRASSLGLVHMVDNLTDPMQVCSCCTCCCGALRMLKDYNVPTVIVGSHFEAAVDETLCNGCGKCAKTCPMEAITLSGEKKKKKARVNYARCIGCGLCIDKCDKTRALSLKERAGHKPPSKNPVDYYSERVQELMGKDLPFLKMLGLGVGSALYDIAPRKLSGPRYKGKG